jgi:hypothetical protein
MPVVLDCTFNTNILDDLLQIAYALKGAQAVVNYLT